MMIMDHINGKVYQFVQFKYVQMTVPQLYLNKAWWKWEESEKGGLKLNIQKTKIMASSPIPSWHIDREKVEAVTDFIFLDSKITVDSANSMKLKDACFLEEKLWQTKTAY